MVNSEDADRGLVVTTGRFTADAKAFSDEHSKNELIDDSRLAELVKQYLVP